MADIQTSQCNVVAELGWGYARYSEHVIFVELDHLGNAGKLSANNSEVR